MAAKSSQQMAELLKTALQTQPAGVLTVIVDGQTVTYNRSQAISELEFWERRAAIESGRRRRTMRIRLDGF